MEKDNPTPQVSHALKKKWQGSLIFGVIELLEDFF